MNTTTFATWLLALCSVVSLVTVARRRPWTMIVARRHTPPEVWVTALFLETNMLMTCAWGALFAAGAILTAVGPWWLAATYGALLLSLGRLSPRFGSWYSARRLRSMG